MRFYLDEAEAGRIAQQQDLIVESKIFSFSAGKGKQPWGVLVRMGNSSVPCRGIGDNKHTNEEAYVRETSTRGPEVVAG